MRRQSNMTCYSHNNFQSRFHYMKNRKDYAFCQHQIEWKANPKTNLFKYASIYSGANLIRQSRCLQVWLVRVVDAEPLFSEDTVCYISHFASGSHYSAGSGTEGWCLKHIITQSIKPTVIKLTHTVMAISHLRTHCHKHIWPTIIKLTKLPDFLVNK